MNSYVLAVTGASAQPLAEKSIELLLNNDREINLIISSGAYKVWESEKGIIIPKDLNKQEKFWRERFNTNKGILNCHNYSDNSAPIASGSYKTKAMVIVPCSMGTAGRIASGVSSNLIERCADVHLKENRPLVIAPRESPLNLIHLRNLTKLCEAGASISPPIPSWYSKPDSINDLIDFIVVRLFDNLGENLKEVNRWGQEND